MGTIPFHDLVFYNSTDPTQKKILTSLVGVDIKAAKSFLQISRPQGKEGAALPA